MANTIQGSFGLDINPLRASANKAIGITKAMADKIEANIGATVKSISADFVALGVAAFGSTVIGVKSVVALGDQLKRMSDQTGLAVGSLAKLQSFAASSGTDFDSLAASVNKMQRSLFEAGTNGSSPAADALNIIGLNAGKLATLAPEAQFRQIGTTIAALSSPLLRSAEAMAIFGKSGAELLPLFNELGSANFGQLDVRAAILQRDADLFARTSGAIRLAGENFQGLFIGIADAIAPLMLAGAQLFNSQNAVAWGQKIGAGITRVVDIAAGIWDKPNLAMGAMLANLKYGAALWSNMIVNGVVAWGELGLKITEALGKGLGGYMLKASGDLLSGLGKSIVFFESGLEYAFQNGLAFLNSGWTNIFDTVKNGLTWAFSGALDFLKTTMEWIWTKLGDALKGLFEGLAKVPGLAKSAKDALVNFVVTNPFVKEAGKAMAAPQGTYKAQLFDEIYNRNLKQSGLVNAGGKVSAQGDVLVASLSLGLSNALNNFGTQLAGWYAGKGADYFGAAGLKAAAMIFQNQLAAAGQSSMSGLNSKSGSPAGNVDWGDPIFKTQPGLNWKHSLPTFKHDFFKGSKGGWQTLGGPMLSDHGGVQGATGLHGASLDLSTPHAATGLMGHRELMGLMNQQVAQGITRPGTSRSAFDVIARGDHDRSRANERHNSRLAASVDTVDAIRVALEGIARRLGGWDQ